MKILPTSVATLLLLITLAGCDQTKSKSEETLATENQKINTEAVVATQDAEIPAVEKQTSPVTKVSEIVELEWDDLLPADWRLDSLIEEYNIEELSDDDPRAVELMKKIETFWKEAPVVNELDGKRVKLPGFVVPLEADTRTIQEFLLVPYYGACIHTPPPPANQTVYVITNHGQSYEGGVFDTVWVTGTLKVEKFDNELGNAGYRINATVVEPYEEPYEDAQVSEQTVEN